MGHIPHREVIVIEQVGIASLSSSTHATPELVQLGEAVALGAIDNQRVGVGDIEPGFDDGRRHQNVEASLPKIHHDPLQVSLPHLPVGDRHAGLRNQLLNPRSHTVDAGDPVVHKKDLAFAQKLPSNCGDHLGFVVRPDKRQNRMARLGGCGERGHFPNAGDRHLESPGYRGCRHSQHIHIGLEGFEGVFVLNTKALLLIHNDEA